MYLCMRFGNCGTVRAWRRVQELIYSRGLHAKKSTSTIQYAQQSCVSTSQTFDRRVVNDVRHSGLSVSSLCNRRKTASATRIHTGSIVTFLVNQCSLGSRGLITGVAAIIRRMPSHFRYPVRHNVSACVLLPGAVHLPPGTMTFFRLLLNRQPTDLTCQAITQSFYDASFQVTIPTVEAAAAAAAETAAVAAPKGGRTKTRLHMKPHFNVIVDAQRTKHCHAGLAIVGICNSLDRTNVSAVLPRLLRFGGRVPGPHRPPPPASRSVGVRDSGGLSKHIVCVARAYSVSPIDDT
jgi:hypothetical protein